MTTVSAARSDPISPALPATGQAGAPVRVLWVVDSWEAAEAAQVRTFMRATDPSRVRVDLAVLRGPGPEERFPEARRGPLRIHSVEAGGTHAPAAFLRFCRLVRGGGYELLHTHRFHASQWGGAAGRMLGVPVVATLYGRPSEEAEASARKREAWVLRRWARRVMAQSGAQWDQYVREGIFSRAVLEVVHPGVDVPSEVSRRASALRLRRIYDLPAEAPVAVTMADLAEWDSGVDTLLWAIPGVLEKVPDARFVIVGDGATRSELERRTRARGLTRFVRWSQKEEEASRILAGADLCVQPSLRNTFPVDALTAMAWGLPVVGTRVGGVPEIIGSADVGRLVPRSDPAALVRAVSDLLENPERLGLMGAAARRRVREGFSALRWVERMEGLYREVLEEVRSGRPQRSWSHARFSVELLSVEARPR